MEMVEQIILAMGLFINAILDIKKRQISVLVVLLMAIFEIGYKFYYDLILFPECILSIIPGLIMIIISFFSDQSIGYGDGLLVSWTVYDGGTDIVYRNNIGNNCRSFCNNFGDIWSQEEKL